MSKDIRISKGLDIKLIGEANPIKLDANPSSEYAVVPAQYYGVIPRLIKRDGDTVKAGEPVFQSKLNENLVFVSPISGTIKEVHRGEKRKILEILIEPDGTNETVDLGKIDTSSRENIIDYLLRAGVWPFIKQRPYDVIAEPKDTPKDIFISAYNSAPIAPDVDFLLAEKAQYLQSGIDLLNKLTSGKVHVTIKNGNTQSVFNGLNNLELHQASGPHPVGNVSTQIAQISPINKGERVWTLSPEAVAAIGELVETGKFNQYKKVAVNGPRVENPGYVWVQIGQKISDALARFTLIGDNNRIVDGNPISGTKVTPNDFVGYYTNQLCVLEEGDDYDFMGWNRPRPNKFSVLRANMFSFLTPNKKYALTTNTNGEERAFVMTGMYEKVFPLDIYPMQLLKSILYNDLDEMENLGIYEVAPEDFALTEFICVSKIQHQEIIRKGLDKMILEVG